MQKKHRIAVLGGGSFGTAIANMIAANGNSVILWMRDPTNAEQCRASGENTRYLPGYKLESNLEITADLEAAVKDSDVVFFSVPSKAFRDMARQAAPLLKPNALVISTAKGIEPDSYKLMSQVLREELSDVRIGVMSGPNLAKEIAQKQITATVIASEDDALCSEVQNLLGSKYFRVYANNDSFGVELAGALKNVYAIISGFVHSMGLGQNTMGVLITRSLAEMSRMAARFGANPMTFLGLSGVGDLYVTCTSPLSRNFQIGQALGQGLNLEQAIEKVGQVAEGINTTRIVKEAADEMDVYMPLANALYSLMFEGKPVNEVLERLMLAEQARDVEFVAGQ